MVLNKSLRLKYEKESHQVTGVIAR